MTEVKTSKITVVLDIYSTEVETSLSGRLLGLINDIEFNAIVNSKKLQRGVLTKETIPLVNITKNYKSLEDYRVVVAIRERDGEQFYPSRLFISDKLSVVSFIQPGGNCAFTDRSQAYIMIEEKEVEDAKTS
jgi:hypothetical protein